MLRNIIGPPARGDDFFDREETVELVWKRLDAGNVLLAAPRRFGKTSVMYRLIDRPEPGWKPVHLDAESIREPINFVIALLDALLADRQIREFFRSAWKRSSTLFRELFDEIELTSPWDVGLKIKLKERMKATWQDHGEALLRSLRTYDRGRRLLVIIDELPVMLYLFRDNGVSDTEVRAFLYWFRRMRTDPQIGLTNCRFLIGGSIGIESYLSELNAVDSFNDFERVTLPELTSRRAADFLEQLLESRQVALSPSAQSKILSLIGVPMPYFIQIFVNEVASEQVNKPASLGPRRLEEIYQGRVLGASCKSYFQHYYDRLRHYFDKQEEDAAKALLKELALAQPRPVRGDHLYTVYRKVSGESGTEDGFARLVAALENDFYIRYHSADRGYYFASKILCDWWRRYYAF